MKLDDIALRVDTICSAAFIESALADSMTVDVCGRIVDLFNPSESGNIDFTDRCFIKDGSVFVKDRVLLKRNTGSNITLYVEDKEDYLAILRVLNSGATFLHLDSNIYSIYS